MTDPTLASCQSNAEWPEPSVRRWAVMKGSGTYVGDAGLAERESDRLSDVSDERFTKTMFPTLSHIQNFV